MRDYRFIDIVLMTPIRHPIFVWNPIVMQNVVHGDVSYMIHLIYASDTFHKYYQSNRDRMLFSVDLQHKNPSIRCLLLMFCLNLLLQIIFCR